MKENSLLNKLDHLVSRFEEVNTLISDPNVISDMQRYVKLNKEYSELQKIMEARNEYKNAYDSIEEAKQILDNESDSELRQLAQDELSEYSKQLPKLEEKIKYLLIPSDPEDDKNVIMEIRGGTGGDEAAIFAGDLYKMYSRFCESKGWTTEITSLNEGTSGGFKEIIFTVSGNGVYGIHCHHRGKGRRWLQADDRRIQGRRHRLFQSLHRRSRQLPQRLDPCHEYGPQQSAGIRPFEDEFRRGKRQGMEGNLGLRSGHRCHQ